MQTEFVILGRTELLECEGDSILLLGLTFRCLFEVKESMVHMSRVSVYVADI